MLVVACFESPLELEERGADFHKYFDMFPVEARDVRASTKHAWHLVAHGTTCEDKETELEPELTGVSSRALSRLSKETRSREGPTAIMMCT